MSEHSHTHATAAVGCHAPAPTLIVDGLSGGYDGRDVFRDVRLVVHAGETVRIEGANAAGKSTLVRCLTGIQRPRTGRVSICDHDLSTDPVAAKSHLGYSAGTGSFTYLTGREHLRLASRVHRLSHDHEARLLDRFANWPVVRGIDQQVRRYSHGMRQQLPLMLAVIHNPCLLILDEAVDGLDDEVLADWAQYLHTRASAGRSLVFVEHREEVAAGFPAAYRLQLSGPATKKTTTEVVDDA